MEGTTTCNEKTIMRSTLSGSCSSNRFLLFTRLVVVAFALQLLASSSVAAKDDGDESLFVPISGTVPQDVTEVNFPPFYESPCREVPKTKFTLRPSSSGGAGGGNSGDGVQILTYPADLVTVSTAHEDGRGHVLQLDFTEPSANSTAYNDTLVSGVIIEFPAGQLERIGVIERDQVVNVEDGFTSVTALSQISSGGVLTATFTQLATNTPLQGVVVTTAGKATVVSNVGFDAVHGDTAGTVQVAGDVTLEATADTGSVVTIDGSLLGTGSSATGSLLTLLGDPPLGPNANVTTSTGGRVESVSADSCASVTSDITGGGCEEIAADAVTSVTIDSTNQTLTRQGIHVCCEWWNVACQAKGFTSSAATRTLSDIRPHAFMLGAFVVGIGSLAFF